MLQRFLQPIRIHQLKVYWLNQDKKWNYTMVNIILKFNFSQLVRVLMIQGLEDVVDEKWLHRLIGSYSKFWWTLIHGVCYNSIFKHPVFLTSWFSSCLCVLLTTMYWRTLSVPFWAVFQPCKRKTISVESSNHHHSTT